jgi:hypothetical protein
MVGTNTDVNNCNLKHCSGNIAGDVRQKLPVFAFRQILQQVLLTCGFLPQPGGGAE